MARKDESLLNLLIRVPWWISIALAVVFYCVLKFFVPLLTFESISLKAFSQAAPVLAPIVAFFFVIEAGMSAFERGRKGRMLDSRRDIATVGALSWKQFEELVSEVFRRQGYFVLENSSEGADGGVDLRLRKDGKEVYVQCKHWKARQVGVKVVRELYGVMMDKHADEGVVVTYGTFTREARDFIRGKPISLVDGNKLIGLIGEVQKNPKVPEPEKAEKRCPKCGSGMVLRTAKKGTHAGQKFWGCTRFPECRTILKTVAEDEEADMLKALHS